VQLTAACAAAGKKRSLSIGDSAETSPASLTASSSSSAAAAAAAVTQHTPTASMTQLTASTMLLVSCGHN